MRAASDSGYMAERLDKTCSSSVHTLSWCVHRDSNVQRQAGRVGQTIADKTLLLFDSTAMLTSEQFPRANNDWEERAKRNKTWE